MKKKELFAGIIIGSLLTATGAFAVQYVATDNAFPIKVNGNNATMEGYNIEGSTYFKLRDIADTVGGFDVDFKENTICIDQKPEFASNTFSVSAQRDESSSYVPPTEMSNSFTYNNKVYIPADEIAKALGCRVYQDPKTNDIYISSKLYYSTSLSATVGNSSKTYPVVFYRPAEDANSDAGLRRYIDVETLTNLGFIFDVVQDNGNVIWNFYLPKSSSSSYPSSSNNNYKETQNKAAYESELAAINAKYDAMINAVRSSYQSGTASSMSAAIMGQQIQQYEQQRQNEINILNAKYGY